MPLAARSPTVGRARSRFAAGLIVGGLLALGLYPLLRPFLVGLGEREQYEFFPLLLLAAAALAVQRLRELPGASVRQGTWGVAGLLLAAAALFTSAGGALYLRWLAAPAAWLTLASIVWRLGGPAVARALLPVGVLLLAIVPPPGHLDVSLTRSLQQLAVRASSRLLDLVGVPHVVAGAVLEVPGRRLMIENACSGINSLVSVVAFTLLFAFLRRRSPVAVVLLVAVSGLFVLGANVVRIALGAVFAAQYRIDVLENSLHEFSGLVLFGVCLGLVASADELVHLLLPPLRSTPSAGAVGTHGTNRPTCNSSVEAASSRPAPAAKATVRRGTCPDVRRAVIPHGLGRPGPVWWAFGLVFAAVGMFNHVRLADCWPRPRLTGAAVLSPPVAVGNWTLVPEASTSVERTESFAKHSKHWTYRKDDAIVQVALTYPILSGQHDPSICYRAAGWTVGNHTAMPPPADRGGGRGEVYYRMDLARGAATRGHLLHGMFDEAGNWVDGSYPVTESAGWLADAVRVSQYYARKRPTHELQVLLAAPPALVSSLDLKDLDGLFLAVGRALVPQVVQQISPPAGGRP